MLRYFSIIAILFSLGCKQQESSEPGFGKACTLVAAANYLEIKIDDNPNLPEQLAFSMNGGEINHDTCEGQSGFRPVISNTDEGLIAWVDQWKEDFQFYFEEYNSEPNSDEIELTLYGRDNCSDPLTEIQTFTGNIAWTASYPNGDNCGQDGFSGTSDLRTSQ